MRAKCIREDLSFLKSKDSLQVITEYADEYMWNNLADMMRNFFHTLNEKGISKEYIQENYEKIYNILTEAFQQPLSYMLDVEMDSSEVLESLEDTLKPKDLNKIIAILQEEGWDEMELTDGRRVWLIEKTYRGMAGEPQESYTLFTEDGKEYPLNNETLDELPFSMDDRQELVQFMDDWAESSAATIDQWIR